MSVIVIDDGDTIELDPRDRTVILLDWDSDALPAGATVSSSAIRIAGMRPAGIAVASLSRSGSVATVTTADDHGYATGDYATIEGADQTEYNTTAAITVTGATTFTYPVSGTPTTPATGSITAATGLGFDQASIPVVDKLLDDGSTLKANRYVQVRLIGGGDAALGKEFEVSNSIVTDETPTQTKDRSFRVVIADL